MNDETTSQGDWQVVVVGTTGARCQVCGEPIERGERAWYLKGRGVQHFECSGESSDGKEV